MNEQPDAHQLSVALEEELRRISADAPADIRIRLLVAAHCAGLVKRELAATAQGFQPEVPDVPDVNQANLVGEILCGERDSELAGLRASMKNEVRARLAVANPGYAQD